MAVLIVWRLIGHSLDLPPRWPRRRPGYAAERICWICTGPVV